MGGAQEFLGAPLWQYLEIWLLPYKFSKVAFKRRTSEEQHEHNKRVSGADLKKQLGWLSLAAMGTGSMIATGIFTFMPYIFANITGPAVIGSLLIASATAALSALLYSEFAVEYPVVGGGFVYVLNVFGELPAVLCGVNLVIDYIFGNAAVVRNFSVYVLELANKSDNVFQKDISGLKDPVDFMVLIVCFVVTAVCLLSMKAFDDGNIILQVAHIGLVVFTFVVAFTKSNTSYWKPFFPDTLDPSGARTLVTGAANIFFVFIGYDVIALGAEEAKSQYSVPIGMLACVIFVTLIYCAMSASLVMLVPFSDPSVGFNEDYNFALALRLAGLKKAKYVVAAGALVGIFTSIGVGVYGLSRIITVFAREGLLPAVLGKVSTWTLTPWLAVLISGVASAALGFFTSFATLANMTSIGTLTMYWFVAVAHIYRRYCPEFMDDVAVGDRHLSIPFRPDVFKFLGVTGKRILLLFYLFIICAAPIGFTIYWNLEGDKNLWLYICTGVWAGATLLLQLTMPIEFVPEKFHIGWLGMPWLPSMSIYANIVLVGGFGAHKDDYWRLFIAMAIATGFYILFGVPTTYYRFYRDIVSAPGKPARPVYV